MTEATSARRGNGNAGARLRPLTERILAAFPGPRPLGILVWALVPALNAGANLLVDTGSRSAIWEQRHALVVLNYVVLSLAIVVTLWGTRRIARRLEELRASTAEMFERSPRAPFRELNSRLGPLVATTATAIALALSALAEGGPASAVLRGATWLLVGIPLWTFMWTYASLQFGLIRLGRERLLPDSPSLDPGLGLRPLGDVAFMGLWMLLAWLVPLVLTGLPDVVGVLIGLAVLAAGLAAFFYSLLGLHRQLAEAKANELAIARNLYAEAYEPVRTQPTLEALERQRGLLSAAEALEKRAEAIHEWPIDEGTMARVLTVATSVVAITVARLILDPLGL